MILAKLISGGGAQTGKHQAYYKAAGHSISPLNFSTIQLLLTREKSILQSPSRNFILELILRNPFNSNLNIQKRRVCFVLLIFSASFLRKLPCYCIVA